MVYSSIAYSTWESQLSSSQQTWFLENGQELKQSIYIDEQLIGRDLDDLSLSRNIDYAYPLFCYQVALASGHHTQSMGPELAESWVQLTYANQIPAESNDVMFNFNVGRQFSVGRASGDLGDPLYNYMFISGSRYRIPGEVQVGTYNGVPLYSAFYLQFGSFTLPASTRGNSRIYLDVSQTNDQDLIRHEFGHVLQGEELGLSCYYGTIVKESISSAYRDDPAPGGHRHRCFYTETDANYRSATLLQMQYPNTTWNEGRFPFTCSGYEAKTPCQ
jgi:hypothetical protein